MRSYNSATPNALTSVATGILCYIQLSAMEVRLCLNHLSATGSHRN